MNKVIIMGRLTRDPEIRYTKGAESIAVGKYTIAVDRKREQAADFIPIAVFGKGAEFAERYLHKGMKILVTGRIQTGSYTNKDGVKVYTTEVVAEDQEFTESKRESEGNTGDPTQAADMGFMNVDIDLDDLPFR